MKKLLIQLLILIALTMLLVSCSNAPDRQAADSANGSSASNLGGIAFNVTWLDGKPGTKGRVMNLIPAGVTRMYVVVSGDHLSSPVVADFDVNAGSGTISGIEAGDCTVLLEGRDASNGGGNLLYVGGLPSVTVTAGQTSAISDPVRMIPSGDHGDTAGTATEIFEDGSWFPGQISSSSDVDFFEFYYEANTTYTFLASGIGNMDTAIVLYDTDGVTPIGSDDDSGGGLDSMLSGYVQTAGTYYLAVGVSPTGSASSGEYFVSVEQSGYTPDTTAPYTASHSPAKNATGVAVSTDIVVHILDADIGVAESSVVMAVEGSTVTPVISGDSSDLILTYNPPTDFAAGQVVNVTINASDFNNNAMTQDVYSFTCAGSQGDSTAPVPTATTINAGSTQTTSKDITLALTATDDVGISGYFLADYTGSNSPANPGATDQGWVSVTPTASYSNSSVAYTLANTYSDGDLVVVMVWYKDAAGNVSGNGWDNITVAAPPSPQNLAALPGNTQNVLTWDAVTGMTSYNVYWAAATGVTQTTGTGISVSTNSYTHSSLTNDIPYYYVVTAIGDFGESADSAQASGTPTASDTTAPAVSSLSPANNAVDVSVDTNISFNITDAGGSGVSQTSLNVTVGGTPAITSGAAVSPYNGSNSAVTSDGSGGYSVTIDPITSFVADTPVSLVVNATDITGNTMATFTAGFTTAAAPDTTAPAVSARAPAAGASNIAVSTSIYFEVDDNVGGSGIASSSLNVYVNYDTTYDTSILNGVPQTGYSTSTIASDGNGGFDVTVVPDSSFPVGATVSVTINVSDTSANPLNPADNYSFACATPYGWNASGTLNQARSGHTMTLLESGQVLAVGGYGSGYLSSTELFSPVTNTWTQLPAGSDLTDPRLNHTATRLSDGDVLVAGGRNSGGRIATAELYNPASQVWTYLSSALTTERDHHTATLLDDGRVLFVGGYSTSNGTESSAELYDPATSTWDTTASLTTARQRHTATLLDTGNVLVAGGQTTSGADDSFEIYDTNTGTWSAPAPMGASPIKRLGHTATLLPDGTVLIIGGDDIGSLNTMTLYDPSSGWSNPVATLNVARYNHAVALLNDGQVLIAGGQGSSSLRSSELYDPSATTPAWSTSPGDICTTANYFGYAVNGGTAGLMLSDGRFLIAGGYNSNTFSAESYSAYYSYAIPTDDQAPVVGYRDPADAATDVAVTTDIYLEIQDPLSTAGSFYGVDRDTITVSLTRSGDTLTYAIVNGVFQSGFSGLIIPDGVGGFYVTITPAASLTSYYVYNVKIDADDLAPAPNSMTQDSYSFSTIDNVPPYTSGHNPADGAASVALSSNIVVTVIDSMGIGVDQSSITMTVEGTDVSSSLTFDTTSAPTQYTVTYNPPTDFSYGQVVNVTVDASDSETPANAMTQDVYSFTCVLDTAAPTITGYVPAHLAAGVAVDSNIYFELDDAGTGVDNSTLNVSIEGQSAISGGSFQSGFSGTVASDGAGGVDVTIAHTQPFNYGTQIDVLLTVSDNSGNQFLLGSSEYYFTTVNGQWSASGSISSPRQQHDAVLLPDGNVVITGGWFYDTTYHYIGSCESYDSTATWSSAGTLNTARIQHITVPFTNGDILVAGGAMGNAMQTCELGPPGAAWDTTVTNMNYIRKNHSATVLPDGRVFVAGGNGWTSDLAECEIYDSTTNTWDTTSSMNQMRAEHAAVLLDDGRVLVVGGQYYDTQYNYLSSAEVYDPARDFWSDGGTLSQARRKPTVTKLKDGRVLIAGGDVSGTPQTSCDIFDPSTDSISPTASLAVARTGHASALLNNGKALIAGGGGSNLASLSTTCELFDPVTETWSDAGDLNAARKYFTATKLNDGKVLIVGGRGSGAGYDFPSASELYDYSMPTDSTSPSVSNQDPPEGQVGVSVDTEIYFEINDPLVSGQSFSGVDQNTITVTVYGYSVITGGVFQGSYSGAIVPNGKGGFHVNIVMPTTLNQNTVYYVSVAAADHAGNNNGGSLLAYYSFTTEGADAWDTTFTYLNTSRYNHTSTVLDNGKVLVAGGYYDDGSTPDYTIYGEVLSPATATWTNTPIMNYPREYHTATLLDNGDVLVAGGYNPTYAYFAYSEVYSPANNTWTGYTSGSYPHWMNYARAHHTATKLDDGTVLVTGGYDGSVTLNKTEFYDPDTQLWSYDTTAVSDLNQARQLHTATLLNDGTVLVVAGFDTAFINTAETYDPATGVWSYTANNLTTGRYAHTATKLDDGKVLVAGGYYSSYENTAEIYDPATRTWSSTGMMATGRAFHQAVLLPSGDVLVTGGRISSTSFTNTCELYSPSLASWVTADPLTYSRAYHNSVLLQSGHALTIGGQDYSSGFSISPCERYTP